MMMMMMILKMLSKALAPCLEVVLIAPRLELLKLRVLIC